MEQSIQEQLLLQEEYEIEVINNFKKLVLQNINNLPDEEKIVIKDELNLIGDLDQLEYFKSSELFNKFKLIG